MSERPDLGAAVEVRLRRGWVRLGGSTAAVIGESDLLDLRGVRPGTQVLVDSVERHADEFGRVQVLLRAEPELRGHLGLIEITVDGRAVGEVDIRPDKLSESAYQGLRADLERVWSGLVLDPQGRSRLRAERPPPAQLWRELERPLADVLADPRSWLVQGEGVRRLEQVRRSSEINPALVRAGSAGRPARVQVTVRTASTPENAVVADTLRRLHAYARRHPDGAEVALATARHLHEPPMVGQGAMPRTVPASMHRDARYRRIDRVRRVLLDPQARPTEGPGELRLGVKGLIRLYEYWVFLQVLIEATDRYGPPDAPGFDALAVSASGGRKRLELRGGTTMTFPGPVHVAFEPCITARADGWMGIEYVPHPDLARFQSVATPDVVVYRPGPDPWISVIDAKYAVRGRVERAAADLHIKYARMRVDAVPAVRRVIAAHPNPGFQAMWAGYGHVPMVPGEANDVSAMRALLPPAWIERL